MPNGRRKIPFSGKKKKEQLMQKKQSKTNQPFNLIRKINQDETEGTDETVEESVPKQIPIETIQKLNEQPSKSPNNRNNRYVLQFHRETPKELKEMKEEARKPLVYAIPSDFEIDDSYFNDYDVPQRPKWSFEMSKAQLDANENRYFFKYITHLEKTHYDEMKTLSYCELNLETWRQLWRVLELSDIVLIIVDIRFPTLMFPPALYDFVTKELGKTMILVLNKIDLSPAPIVLAWKKYFEEKYKSIHIVLFTSYPSYNLRGCLESKTGLQIRRRKGRLRMATEGAQQVYDVCKEITAGAVDLSSWQQKIIEESSNPVTGNEDDADKLITERTHDEEKDFDFEEHVKYKNGVVTIGCVGFPNVGKSSLLNALMGRKVVSVSRTPGHTKHFQTIFLTNTVRLCDCPGLVFPSSTPRRLQVLLGSYPIAQLREPYGAIKFLAERINLPHVLTLKHPENKKIWSAIDICDAWANKRGFITAKSARADTYRAANNILRMALEGKFSFSLRPISYTEQEDFWSTHPELEIIKAIQLLGKTDDADGQLDEYYYDSDSDNQQAPSNKTVLNKSIFKDDIDESSDEVNKNKPATSNPFDLLNNDADND